MLRFFSATKTQLDMSQAPQKIRELFRRQCRPLPPYSSHFVSTQPSAVPGMFPGIFSTSACRERSIPISLWSSHSKGCLSIVLTPSYSSLWSVATVASIALPRPLDGNFIPGSFAPSLSWKDAWTNSQGSAKEQWDLIRDTSRRLWCQSAILLRLATHYQSQ